MLIGMTLGKTQAQIAREMGVPQPAVARWFAGGSFPRPETLKRLAEVLGVEVDALVVELHRRRREKVGA
jgi:transcriptional regulator with XRE-family HTH domain